MTTEESDWVPPGEAVLDGATIRSEADLHRTLAAALDFGPSCGEVAGCDAWIVDGHRTNSWLGYVHGGGDRSIYQPPTDWTEW